MNRAQQTEYKRAIAIGAAGDVLAAAKIVCKIYRDGNDATKRQMEAAIGEYPAMRRLIHGTCRTGYSAVAPRECVYTWESRYTNPDKSTGVHIQRWKCVTVYEDADVYDITALELLEETGRPTHFPANTFTRAVFFKRFPQPRVQFL